MNGKNVWKKCIYKKFLFHTETVKDVELQEEDNTVQL